MNIYMLREGYPVWTRRKIALCRRCGWMEGFSRIAIGIHVARCKECGNRNRDPLPWTELFPSMRAEEVLKEWDQ